MPLDILKCPYCGKSMAIDTIKHNGEDIGKQDIEVEWRNDKIITITVHYKHSCLNANIGKKEVYSV